MQHVFLYACIHAINAIPLRIDCIVDLTVTSNNRKLLVLNTVILISFGLLFVFPLGI